MTIFGSALQIFFHCLFGGHFEKRGSFSSQPRPQGLLAFQYGGGSGEDPGTQQSHVTKISNEDGNVFKMAAKAK